MVVYTEEDDFWLEVGQGIYSSLYVDEIADMADLFYKNLLDGSCENAVSVLMSDLAGWYETYYGDGTHYTASGNSDAWIYEGPISSGIPSYEQEEVDDGNAFLGFLILVWLLTIPLRRRRRRSGAGLWPFLFLGSASRSRNSGSYHSGSSFYHSSGSSSHSSYSSGSSFHSGGGHSGGGFSSGHSSGGHSSGGSFHGGGGHSGGGFGHR